MNYISGISNNAKIGVISWSQGSLDTQWALQYWPSTHRVVDDFIPISGDFNGSVLTLPCPGFPTITCTPAIIQQAATLSFIAAIRTNGGDSAYVPTTSVYSGIDEVVEPQMGTGASAYIKDERKVGVSNTQLQLACPGQIAGSFYTHEGMLVNPLAWALAVDALTHDGPGDLSRIDLDTVCGQFLPPGLTLEDFLGTEATLVLAAVNIIEYGYIGEDEPPIKAYATQSQGV
jgi:hypothetical protein